MRRSDHHRRIASVYKLAVLTGCIAAVMLLMLCSLTYRQRPTLPPGLGIEWDWPARIYDTQTFQDLAPSLSVGEGYEVDNYWVAQGVVYGTLKRDERDATIYFIIASVQGGFVETEYFSRKSWLGALAELDIESP